MKIGRVFAVPGLPVAGDAALLLLRLVMGSAFVLHGWGKIQKPFGWMGEGAFAPAPIQALAALSEFGGGMALILGLVTPLAALGLLCTMATATYMHAVMLGDPFVLMAPPLRPSFELPATYFCIASVLAAIGPGRLSLDRIVFGKR